MRGIDRADRPVPPALLAVTAETLRRLGPRQFSLTAVAEAAEVSRGTVHNALGSRDNAIKVALDHLASVFVETVAAEIAKEPTLSGQVAAAAVLVCAHRRQSDAIAARGVNESILVLLLRNIGDDLVQRSVELWKPLVRAAQERGEVRPGLDAARAGEWIVRMLFSFELLPPMGVNLDSPRAVRLFMSDHIIDGLGAGSTTSGEAD